FFCQAEDGIRDWSVTGVQTCALPISPSVTGNLRRAFPKRETLHLSYAQATVRQLDSLGVPILAGTDAPNPGTGHGVSLHRELERSEERRVGEEARRATARGSEEKRTR